MKFSHKTYQRDFPKSGKGKGENEKKGKAKGKREKKGRERREGCIRIEGCGSRKENKGREVRHLNLFMNVRVAFKFF